MPRSAVVTTLSWLASIPLILYGLFTTGWMDGGDLRGRLGMSWAAFEAHEGSAAVEQFGSAGFYGPATFWVAIVALISMAPAIWMFRYGRRIGRLWVAAGLVLSGVFAVLFTYSMPGSAHTPCYVYWIGVAVALQGIVVGAVMRDPPAETL